MGWRERDYARFNDAEREAFYGSAARVRPPRSSVLTAGTGRRFGFVPGAGLAIAGSMLVCALTHYPSGHPLVPWPPVHLPFQSHHGSLDLGASVVAVGSGADIFGRLPDRHDGVVLLESSVDGGPWLPLATGAVDADGKYTVSYRYTQPGHVELRLTYPNGDVNTGAVDVR